MRMDTVYDFFRHFAYDILGVISEDMSSAVDRHIKKLLDKMPLGTDKEVLIKAFMHFVKNCVDNRGYYIKTKLSREDSISILRTFLYNEKPLRRTVILRVFWAVVLNRMMNDHNIWYHESNPTVSDTDLANRAAGVINRCLDLMKT